MGLLWGSLLIWLLLGVGRLSMGKLMGVGCGKESQLTLVRIF